MSDDLERLWREIGNLHRQLPAAIARYAELLENIHRQISSPAAKAHLAEMARQFAEMAHKFSRLRVVDVDQIQLPPTPKRKQRDAQLIDKPEDIARGVELARANGGNFSKAARDLYGELHPKNPDASRKQHSDWEAARRTFVGRVRHRIADGMRRTVVGN